MRPFYITTPIYYVNDVPHLGHAYTTVAADALARYHRARGESAWLLTGTDEHGQKIEDVAKARGVTPQAHADEFEVRFRDTWTALDVHVDDFIRTTQPRHERVVQDMWKRLEAAGDIYLGSYEGLYCRKCEAFYPESQAAPALPGTTDLTCPDHKTALERVAESSYMFRMSKYQERLLQHFESHKSFVLPDVRRNEILSFIQSGLRDLSISRTTFGWGIRVPGDEAHVIYVWIDALTNYISALGGPDGAQYKTHWPATCHLIGKDILRFHAVYWPCMLMSAGLELPKHIFAHGWWTVKGEKISKSLPATRVDPNRLAADLGPDSLRYFLLREVPLGMDGDFSYESLIGRHNSDLANDLGNLVNRTVSMVHKYLGGVIPQAHPAFDSTAHHADLEALSRKAKSDTEHGFSSFAPSRALESIWELVRGANRYVDLAAPWTLAKAVAAGDTSKQAELEHVLHTFLESALWCALMAAPVIPGKAAAIVKLLGVDAQTTWPNTEWNALLPSGGMLGTPEPLFPRIDDKQRAAYLAAWLPPELTNIAVAGAPSDESASQNAGPVSTSPSLAAVTYDDFKKLELRVAEIQAAERIPKADKLLKLTVSLGSETRQVVAGIAGAYAPETLIGKRVIFVANLKPAKIRGVESQGMILAAGEEQVLALSALDKDVPAGTIVR